MPPKDWENTGQDKRVKQNKTDTMFNFRGRNDSNTTSRDCGLIAVKKKNIGGISDQSGAFQIDLSRATKADTVVVSYIGYDPHIVSLSNLDFSQRHIIELRPSSHVLKEVVVRSKPEIIILGNKGKSTRHTGWGDFSSSRGRAIGLSIKTPDVSLKINKLFFHLNACEFDSARVRINFFKD